MAVVHARKLKVIMMVVLISTLLAQNDKNGDGKLKHFIFFDIKLISVLDALKQKPLYLPLKSSKYFSFEILSLILSYRGQKRERNNCDSNQRNITILLNGM